MDDITARLHMRGEYAIRIQPHKNLALKSVDLISGMKKLSPSNAGFMAFGSKPEETKVQQGAI